MMKHNVKDLKFGIYHKKTCIITKETNEFVPFPHITVLYLDGTYRGESEIGKVGYVPIDANERNKITYIKPTEDLIKLACKVLDIWEEEIDDRVIYDNSVGSNPEDECFQEWYDLEKHNVSKLLEHYFKQVPVKIKIKARDGKIVIERVE